MLKCWRSMKMLAFYENVGALWKCWRSMKMLALYENVGVLWECWCPMKMSAPYTTKHIKIYNICTSWPSYCLAWQTPQWLLSSAHAGGSRSVLKVLSPPRVVAKYQLPQASQLICVHCTPTGPPWSYRPNVGVLLKYWFYSNIGATQKSLKTLHPDAT